MSKGVLAATITLPVAEVVERPDMRVSTYPGRVVPISQVNVVPQVSGEILEVCFPKRLLATLVGFSLGSHHLCFKKHSL